MRLFVAVYPPARVVKTLAGLARPERAGLRWTPTEQWHVTLRYFGACDVDRGVLAGRRVAEAAARSRPALAELGPALESFGRAVLHVPLHGVQALAETLDLVTADVGDPPRPSPFSGHITLARNRGRGVIADLVGAPVDDSWEVDEIALVVSIAGGPGLANRHEVVATFPLGPAS